MKYKEKLYVLNGLIRLRDNISRLVHSLCDAFCINVPPNLYFKKEETRRHLDYAVEAYKKQIPIHIQFPSVDKNGNIVVKFHCPVCSNNEIEMNQKFCKNCGQALGWGEDVAEEVEDKENEM